MQLTRIQEDLLLALACETKMTMYELAKYDIKRHKIRDTGVRHYPSVLRAMKRLEESALVKKVGRGRGKKGAQTILYSVTLIGLARVIPSFGPPDLRRIAEKHRDLLPTVFDLWPSFIEAKVEDLAGERLRRACGWFQEDLEEKARLSPWFVSSLRGNRHPEIPIPRYPHPKNEIHRKFFCYPPLAPRDEDRWNEVAAQKINKVTEAKRDVLLGYIGRNVRDARSGVKELFEGHLMDDHKQDFWEMAESLETIIQRLEKLETPSPYPPEPPELI
jgi:hypothetical protein